MDIKCRHCGEPWDLDELHDVDGHTFDQARKRFYRDGCLTFGTGHSQGSYPNREAISMLQDLLGDDVDGLAAMLEDFDL